MAEKIECIVIGAGVVGLAVARACASSGMETILLDSAQAIGTATSSRNSEVIHAGIYYPENSLKARFCISGKQSLYAYCKERHIPHNNCGKLIVATSSSQMGGLQQLQANAARSGVNDLIWLTPTQVLEKEPEISCVAALYSPTTGIVDSHNFMLSLLGDFEAAGGVLALCSKVTAGKVLPDSGVLLTVSGAEQMQVEASHVINCAGLSATTVASLIDGLPSATIPAPVYAKGNYFALSRAASFSHLIYPMPDPGGLGVHLTIDMAGRVKFGPDVQWLESIDYQVDTSRMDYFYDAIRKYWPALPESTLVPDYSGIRPKISIGGSIHEDFLIQDKNVHGVTGLVNLYGIESPGLTASLALAQYIQHLL